MTADDVRAKFGFTISDSEPRILTWDGNNGCRAATDEEIALWNAHADLSGEVRELVEADRAVDEANAALDRRSAALAKLTQEKP